MTDDSQVEIGQNLTRVLTEINLKLDKIKAVNSTQVQVAQDLEKSFSKMTDSFQRMNGQIESNMQTFDKLSANLNGLFGFFNNEKIMKSFDQIANMASNNTQQIKKNYTDIEKQNNKETKNLTKYLGETSKTFKKLNSSLGKASAATDELISAMENVEDDMEKNVELQKELQAATDSLVGSSKWGDKAKSIAAGALTLIKNVAGYVVNFLKLSATIPFTVLDMGVKIGNELRRQIVETIGNAGESLKEFFDMSSYIGQGMQSMVSRGTGMLKAFQAPNSELVKLFGFGTDGIANMIQEIGKNINAMGHFSEIFGKSISGNQDNLMHFTKLSRAFGYGEAELAYFAQDAANNLEHVNDRMHRAGMITKKTASDYNIDMKRLSKSFMSLRKDIILFDHLTDEELNNTAARLTHMKVKIEDAAAVFKKFDTFEAAANSVAMLSQTFGMNLDAMDMIRAEKPEEIIDMMRNAMLETGRSFDDLNRFEKDLMAQHTGMSAESLKAMMNFRDLGLTHDEAMERMKKSSPTEQQLKAIKELRSAIKETNKILQFESPFDAILKGFAANAGVQGELRSALLTLSNGYEGLYTWASGLKGETFENLMAPIEYIIRIMTKIFKSESFMGGIKSGLETIGNFASRLLGLSPGEEFIRTMKSVTSSAKTGSNLKEALAKKFEDPSSVAMIDSALKKSKGYEEGFIKSVEAAKSDKELMNILLDMRDKIKNDDAALQNFDNLILKYKESFNKTYEKDNIQATGDDLTEGLNKTVDKMTSGFGTFTSLVGLVAGAVIKGGVLAISSIATFLGSALTDINKEYNDREAQGKQNLIEEKLGWKSGELESLSSMAGTAIVDFFKGIDSYWNISTWLLGQLTEVFGSFALNLGAALFREFGELFGLKEENMSRGMIKASVQSGDFKATAKTAASATEAISKAASGKTGELMSDDFSSRKTQALALESLNTAMIERAKQPISGAGTASPEEIAENKLLSEKLAEQMKKYDELISQGQMTNEDFVNLSYLVKTLKSGDLSKNILDNLSNPSTFNNMTPEAFKFAQDTKSDLIAAKQQEALSVQNQTGSASSFANLKMQDGVITKMPAFSRINDGSISSSLRNKVGNGFLDVVINKVASMKETVAEITSLTKDVYSSNQMESQKTRYLTNEEVDEHINQLMTLKDSIGSEVSIYDPKTRIEEQMKDSDIVGKVADAILLRGDFNIKQTFPWLNGTYALDPSSIVSRAGLEFGAGNQGSQNTEIDG